MGLWVDEGIRLWCETFVPVHFVPAPVMVTRYLMLLPVCQRRWKDINRHSDRERHDSEVHMSCEFIKI